MWFPPLFFVGAVVLKAAPVVLGGGAFLALYLGIWRRRRVALAGLACLVLAATCNRYFGFLWGWHSLVGWRFVLNEYDVPALIGLLTLAGWGCIAAALRRKLPTESGKRGSSRSAG